MNLAVLRGHFEREQRRLPRLDTRQTRRAQPSFFSERFIAFENDAIVRTTDDRYCGCKIPAIPRLGLRNG